jgi:hypothetical protein
MGCRTSSEMLFLKYVLVWSPVYDFFIAIYVFTEILYDLLKVGHNIAFFSFLLSFIKFFLLNHIWFRVLTFLNLIYVAQLCGWGRLRWCSWFSPNILMLLWPISCSKLVIFFFIHSMNNRFLYISFWMVSVERTADICRLELRSFFFTNKLGNWVFGENFLSRRLNYFEQLLFLIFMIPK